MTIHDIGYLTAQLLCIGLFLIVLATLISRYYDKKVGLRYSILRYLFHNDPEPLRWLKAHPVYFDYLLQVIALVFMNLGMIAQIQNKSVYSKPWFFFVGGAFLAISMFRLLKHINTKDDATA